MRSDKIVRLGRSLLRTGLLVTCFLCSLCFLTGCGSEDKLLSELRQEESPAGNARGDSSEDGDDEEQSICGGAGSGEDKAQGASGSSAGDGAAGSGTSEAQSTGAGAAGGDSEGPNAGQMADGNGSTGQGTGAESEGSTGSADGTIYVHVCGAVTAPGVYELPAESRFYEAVDAAGGFAEDACEDYLNMAALLADGSRLEIPTKQEIQERKTAESRNGKTAEAGETNEYNYYTVPEAQTEINGNIKNTGSTGASAEGLVNINTADVTGLCMLPGVGESRAKAIIEYREKQGGFQKKEDIMEVSGIGEKMYAKMEDYLTVE